MAANLKSLLSLLVLVCLVVTFSLQAGVAAEVADVGPDTSIVSLKINAKGSSLHVSGLASGDLGGVELALRRADGWYYRSGLADWTPEPAWQKGTLMPMGTTRFLWDEALGLPRVDDEPIMVLARSIDSRGRPDPTPVGARLVVDNVAPVVKAFDVLGQRWVGGHDIDLIIDVLGAKYMRLAESKNGLEKAKRLRWRPAYKFHLSAGDGVKKLFAAFIDGAGNKTVVELAGGAVGVDTAEPVVRRLFPAAQTKSVSVGARISVGFIEGSDVDPASIRSEPASDATFYLTHNDSDAATIASYDSRTKTASLTPVEPLIEGELYTAHLRPGIKDLVGNTLNEETSWSFRAVEPSPPETKVDSLPEATSRRGRVTVRGRAADPDGISAVNVFVRNQDGRYWDSVSEDWMVEPFANEAKLSLKAGRETGWQWSWRLPRSDGALFVVTAVARDRFLADDPTPAGTSVLVDNQPPVLDHLVLQNGVRVTASDTVDIAGFVTGAAAMRFAENREALKTAPWLSFAPLSRFQLSRKEGEKKVYAQWRDALGNATQAGAAGSTAGIILDKTGPKISSTFPHDQAKDANISVMVTANFEEISLDESGITDETFRLFDPDGNQVAAQITYDAVSKTATLTPLEFLEYGTEYRAVLSGKIKDHLDNYIGHDFGWKFSTVGISTHPPEKPVRLDVVSTERGDRLTWDEPVGADKGRDFKPPTQGGYNIYRAPSEQGPFELVNKVPVSGQNYYDRDWERPGRRFYAVRAVDAGGSESPGSEIVPNDAVDMVFNIKPSDPATVTLSNDLVRLVLPELKQPLRLHIMTKKIADAPATPMPILDFESSPTVSFKRLTLFVPGDSTGAIVEENIASGWQPVTNARYDFDAISRGLTIGPVSSNRQYAIVNRVDATPPPVLTGVNEAITDGRPTISWATGNDSDSGISAYRLWRSESTPTLETTDSAVLVDLAPTVKSFVDYSAEPGRVYHYGVAAVNGSYAAGAPALTEPTMTGRPSIEHKPRVAGASNCRACHVEKRIRTDAGFIECRLCHDGTGSSMIIAGDEETGRSSLCGSCHGLSRDKLDRVGRNPDMPCGGCHAKSTGGGQTIVKANGHTSLESMTMLTCVSCHSLHRPGGRKNKFLVNPANTRKAWSGTTNGFCLSCHASGRQPAATDVVEAYVPRDVVFSQSLPGSLFPGWSISGWDGSSHRRVADCLSCHDPHKSPNNRLVGYRAGSRDKYMYFSETTAPEALCYECHRPGGQRGALDLQTVSRSPSSHNQAALGRHSDTETAFDLGALNRHVTCGDCHNVHRSNRQARKKFTNLTSGSLQGVAGVEPLRAGPGIIPVYVEVKTAVREYQICLRCHSSYVRSAPVDMVDMAAAFNPANLSYHPVETRAKNRGVKVETFVGGWGPKATMYCSDCHTNSESGAARGPHGSKFKPLLAASLGASEGVDHQNDLCYLCHNRKVYTDGEAGSRFEGAGGHGDHVQKKKSACSTCHVTHGSSFTAHLINVVQPLETSGVVGYSHDTTGGSCVSTCHQRSNDVYSYKHAY